MQKLLFFHEKWCSNCEKLEPILDQFRNQIKIDKINLEYSPSDAKQWNITHIPTVIFLEDGEEKRRMVGYNSQEQLVKFLNGEV